MTSEERVDQEEYPAGGGPEDKGVVDLLEDFEPQPSSRFHRRMRKAPWRRRVHRNSSAGPQLRLLMTSMVGVGLALTGVALSLLVMPPVEGLARGMLGFFNHAESDQLVVYVESVNPRGWRLPPPPSPEPLDVDRAGMLAGIQVREPAVIPDGFSFEGAYYITETMGVQLAYVSDGHALLTITQYPAGRTPHSPYLDDVPQVGASAAIQQVRISDVYGEYVRGGWSLEEIPVAVAEEEEVPGLQVVWDPDAAMQALRFQDNFVLYELILVGEVPGGGPPPDGSILVEVARSLRLPSPGEG